MTYMGYQAFKKHETMFAAASFAHPKFDTIQLSSDTDVVQNQISSELVDVLDASADNNNDNQQHYHE